MAMIVALVKKSSIRSEMRVNFQFCLNRARQRERRIGLPYDVVTWTCMFMFRIRFCI